jgi:hypothetical protein
MKTFILNHDGNDYEILLDITLDDFISIFKRSSSDIEIVNRSSAGWSDNMSIGSFVDVIRMMMFAGLIWSYLLISLSELCDEILVLEYNHSSNLKRSNDFRILIHIYLKMIIIVISLSLVIELLLSLYFNRRYTINAKSMGMIKIDKIRSEIITLFHNQNVIKLGDFIKETIKIYKRMVIKSLIGESLKFLNGTYKMIGFVFYIYIFHHLSTFMNLKSEKPCDSDRMETYSKFMITLLILSIIRFFLGLGLSHELHEEDLMKRIYIKDILIVHRINSEFIKLSRNNEGDSDN